MFSLILRNLFFTILQPGVVAGLVPWLLLHSNAQYGFQSVWNWNHTAGLVLFSSGLVIMLTCIFLFAMKGEGTLSPADPTKKLVVSGLYKFSRNPMYVGVMLILAGETLFFRSLSLLIYTVVVFLAFHLFIRFREEPRLKKDFGSAYLDYCHKVGRWI